jgi:transposase
MISFSGSLKIFLLVDCCDMRKGFNGLYGLVSSSFGEDPRSGALYVFCNRRHSRIKVLYFDGTGLWVLSKTNAPQCPQRLLTGALSVSSVLRTDF